MHKAKAVLLAPVGYVAAFAFGIGAVAYIVLRTLVLLGAAIIVFGIVAATVAWTAHHVFPL